MKKYYVITMNDGSDWGVPAELIADNYATHYANDAPDSDYQDEFNTTPSYGTSRQPLPQA